jgi:uncharacterized membrane protein
MKRANYLDALRGLAVLWMILFHTAYDLKFFRLLNWDFAHGFWYAFPRVIAFTFLFCVGASLNFVHKPRPNWKAISKRSVKLGAAALLISVSTYLIFPQQWIYFGTLHCIFIGSLLGVFFVNNRRLTASVLILILMAQYILGYDIRWVSSILEKPSIDFIPIYPWFWAILFGIILEPYLSRVRLLSQMKPQKFLNFLGQHSLKIYLIHQPLIFGSIWAYTQLLH